MKKKLRVLICFPIYVLLCLYYRVKKSCSCWTQAEPQLQKKMNCVFWEKYYTLYYYTLETFHHLASIYAAK